MSNQNLSHLEIEVKFFINDIDLLRNRVLDLNCSLQGREFETNIRYDDKNNTLFKNKSLLRLRKDKHNYLTFKSTPKTQDKDVKIMTEYEVKVNDYESIQHILASLGFVPVQHYEKYRETFCMGNTQILIDTLPYGDFIEIEGDKDHILKLASELGLNWNHRILLNYLAIFEIIKDKLNLPFSDVTFDNFASYKIDVSKFLPIFYPDSAI